MNYEGVHKYLNLIFIVVNLFGNVFDDYTSYHQGFSPLGLLSHTDTYILWYYHNTDSIILMNFI